MEFPLTILALIISVMLPIIVQGQDNQQQSGTCTCPCNSALPGPMGPSGVGLPGVQGPQGISGPAGDPGSNGIPGVPGQPGNTGSKGQKGDTGHGVRGEAGEPGQIGERGLIGDRGSRGHPGKVGPQGGMGLQGQNGNQGQTGVKGDKGDEGTSYTAPPMSAFSARKTASYQVRSGSEVITFEAEDLDVGNDFNPGTGVFTCRIQGLYYFSFTFYFDDDNNFYVYLDQNGVHKAKIHKVIYDGVHIMQSQSVLLSLQEGDEVTIVADHPSYFLHADSVTNIFNGYLIHAT